MDGAGTGIERHMLADDDRHLAVIEWMTEPEPLEINPASIAQHPIVLDAPAIHGVLEQTLGDDQTLPALRRVGLDDDVFQFGIERDGLVRRQGPGGGGPDDDRRRSLAAAVGAAVTARRERLRFDDRKTHVDGDGLLVGVFDLGLGQRRAAVDAPVHRLLALLHMAVGDNPAQRAHDVGLAAEIHRQIGPLPIAEDAEPLEVAALTIDLSGGVLAAGDAKLGGADLVARLALFLLDLEFNRQTVTVPARHIGRVQTVERARFDDDVLEHLVDRMTDMNVPVGVGRAVVQDEGLGPGARGADTGVEIQRLPMLEHLGLALGEVGLHRKAGVGKIQGMLVVSHGNRSRCVAGGGD